MSQLIALNFLLGTNVDEALGTIVRGVCYDNAKRYFAL